MMGGGQQATGMAEGRQRRTTRGRSRPGGSGRGPPRRAESASAAAQVSDLPTPGQHHTSNLWKLTLGSIGVVYGDIGTSPIYAMRESLRATAEATGGPLQRGEVIGVISLLIWSLIVVVTFKVLHLRAPRGQSRRRGDPVLGRLGAAGFGTSAGLAPGARDGGGRAFPRRRDDHAGDFRPLGRRRGEPSHPGVRLAFTIPVTLLIVAGLFFLQRWGTAAVSRLFGP
jgi:KUP system potassium uptake protein